MKASLSSLVKSESPIVITSGPHWVFCKKSRGCNVKNSKGHLAGIIVIIKHRLALSESSIKGWGVMEKNTDNPVDILVPRDLEARFGVRIQRGLTPEDLFKAHLSFSCPSGSQHSKASYHLVSSGSDPTKSGACDPVGGCSVVEYMLFMWSSTFSPHVHLIYMPVVHTHTSSHGNWSKESGKQCETFFLVQRKQEKLCGE